MELPKRIHKLTLKALGAEIMIPLVDSCYEKMINCLVVMPVIGTALRTKGCMKSGWGLTALDNSIIHDAILKGFFEYLKDIVALN